MVDAVKIIQLFFILLLSQKEWFNVWYCRFPLKAVKVMHTVALRTEATIPGGQMPPNIGPVFKV